MTQAQQVPTNGFITPPAGAPAAPTGFTVPPAGDPPRLPSAAGQPFAAANMQPGWVPQAPAELQQPAAPAPAAPAPTLDQAGIAALIQQALGAKPAESAPAQAPAAAPLPEWAQGDLNKFDVAGLEDPIIRSMATVLQTAGNDLDLNRVLGNAITHGDPALVDIAYLAEKGGAQAPQLVEIAKGIVQAIEAKSNAVTKSVHDIAGGESAWNASVSAFNTAAPQELRVTVSQMLNSTNENFIKAGAKIVAEFGKNSGLITQQGSPLLNGAASAVAGQGLSKAQFQSELGKLRPEVPGYEEARQALFARRSLGKASGL